MPDETPRPNRQLNEKEAVRQLEQLPDTSLWAGLGVTSPAIRSDDVTDPQFFSVSLSLVNDGKKTINPEVDSSRFFINEKELNDWSFIIGNGPRGDDFNALRPGECLQFGVAIGNYFTEPGIYRIKWVGKAFVSSEVVFRVLPKIVSGN